MAGPKRVGTLAAYGPDASRATKLVAAVLPDDRAAQPMAMETWTVTEGDVRQDRAGASQVMGFSRGAYPYVIRWLSLPDEGTHAISGDVAPQDGARMLAAVCDGDLAPIQQLIVNREADEFCRDVAMSALALLAAWGEVPRDEIVARLAWLEREGLEREPGQVWVGLASACADLGAVELFPAMRQAFTEGLIDRESMHPSELDEVERTDPDVALEKLRERWPPIDDVAEATSWWAARTQRPRNRPGEPLRVETIGRNEPCPCGSGRKYKKCCGQ